MIRMTTRRASLLCKLLILALVVYGLYTLITLRAQLSDRQAQAAALTAAIATTQQENQRIREDIDAVSTDEGMKNAAYDKLGMVAAGEIDFRDVGN